MADRDTPWPGIMLAIAGSLTVALVTSSPWLALAVAVLWIGTLYIAPPPQPVAAESTNGVSLSHDRMRAMLEHSGVPLLLLDRDRIVLANAAMREVLGKHILGQDARIAFRHPAAVSLLQREGDGETIITGLSGHRSIWAMNVTRIDTRYTLVELHNRTAEADVSRAHTDFVANASHELRTPLASIIGYVETLAEDDQMPTEARRKFLDTVLREARRLQTLVSDLMSLSRVEAEKHELPSGRIDLGKLVRRAAADSGRPEDRDRIACEIEGGPIVITGDERQLEQLVRNLVDNALKYGASDKEVSVRLEVGDLDRALLTVTDQGEGIAEEHLPHLTRRFYRTDPGRSRAAGGTGLGLAIVKHIVERHRGRLDIASQRGQGTSVTVKLPLAETQSPDSEDALS